MAGNHEKIKVEVTHEGQVLRITLATPPANILDGQTMAEIVACLDAEGASKDLKAIVFAGEG